MITIVCGLGHVNEYSLLLVPKSFREENWRCKTEGCYSHFLSMKVDDRLRYDPEDIEVSE